MSWMNLYWNVCDAITYSPELQPGDPESKGTLEGVADCCLTPAKSLWLDKEVTISKRSILIEDDPSDGCCPSGDPCNSRIGFGQLFKERIYGEDAEFERRVRYRDYCCLCAPLVQIPAALTACIGYPLKKWVLENDEEAAAYNQLTKKYTNLKEYEKQKEILTSYLEELKLKLEGIALASASSIEKMRRDLEAYNTGNIRYSQDENLDKDIKAIIGDKKILKAPVNPKEVELLELTSKYNKFKEDLSKIEKKIKELNAEIASLNGNQSPMFAKSALTHLLINSTT